MEREDLIPRRARGVLFAAALAAFLAVPSPAQKKKLPPDDPGNCPWCHGDPALMEAAGIVSHGAFEFGRFDSKRVDASLPTSDIRWIETANFRIGFALGSHKVKLDEKKKIMAELTRLQLVFPDVKPETATLDPWMRTHLYAQRCEDILRRFLQLISGEKEVFPDGKVLLTGPYRGEGPFLGQKAKYEVLVLPNEAAHIMFLTEHAGQSLRVSHRWHNIERGSIGIYCHAQQGQLRTDGALHGHIAFNLAHNLYDGFYHYTYDTPIWLHEGLAHFFEREIDPRFNSFDGGEGAVADMTSKENWKPEVLKLIASGEAPRMAEMMQLKSYGELKLPHHFATWAMMDFLVKTRSMELAQFLRAIKNCKDEKGIPSGSNLHEWHRKSFKDTLGMTYLEFDDAWRAWALGAYKPTTPKGGDPNAPPIPRPGGPVGG